MDIRRDALGNTGGGIQLYASNTVMRIHDGAVVTNLELSAGTRLAGENTRLEVLSGAELYVANGLHQGYEAAVSNIFVRVEDGGRIVSASQKTYQVGNTNQGSDADWNTTLWIGDNGRLDAYYLRFYGYGNALIVSNGTVNVDYEFRTTYSNTEASGGRTRVTFAGASPRFVVNGQYCAFQRDATIRFEIPSGGYTTVPCEQTGATSSNKMSIMDCTLEVDAEQYAKSGGGTLTLMKSNQSISISEAQLTAFQNGLPEGCRLSLSEDGKELQLKVKGAGQGLTIIVR